MSEKSKMPELNDQPYLISEPKDIVDPNKFGFLVWAIRRFLKNWKFAELYKEVKEIYTKNRNLIPSDNSTQRANRE
jgi:hypothetical protein